MLRKERNWNQRALRKYSRAYYCRDPNSCEFKEFVKAKRAQKVWNLVCWNECRCTKQSIIPQKIRIPVEEFE